jgi:streptomycin 6-kinase
VTFDAYPASWDLIPDGEPLITPTSHLLPVRHNGKPAMLKVATEPEEQRGGRLMIWWNGDGAAAVLAHDDSALLLERATGNRSLIEMARSGQDDEATRIICAVAARLHAPRGTHPPHLIPLAEWFRELDPAAERHGGVLRQSAETARELLADQHDIVVLHGDIHHGNILDFGPRGWLAIDPKGLIGEHAFDVANIFCNPDIAVATAPGRLSRQATVVADSAHIDRDRLLRWILAYAGLSAAWFLGDGMVDEARLPLTVAEIAAAAIHRRQAGLPIDLGRVHVYARGTLELDSTEGARDECHRYSRLH